MNMDNKHIYKYFSCTKMIWVSVLCLWKAMESGRMVLIHGDRRNEQCREFELVLSTRRSEQYFSIYIPL